MRLDTLSSRWLVFLSALALGVVACDGGNTTGAAIGVTTSISVAPTSVSFVFAASADALQTQTVRATFKGDGVVVGYATGVTPAAWLTVQQMGAAGADTATFALTARTPAGLAVGAHRTTLRFATGRLPPGADLSLATDVVFVDVPVELTVPIAVQPASISLTVIDGSGAAPAPADARAFSLWGTSAWTATSDAPWLTLGQAAGTAPSQLPFAVKPDGLAVGVHDANVDVRVGAGGGVSGTVRLRVSLTVTAPQLTTSVNELAFQVDGATTRQQLSRSLIISDEIDGRDAKRSVSWKVQSIDAPWLGLTDVVPASGTSSPPTTVAVTLDLARLDALANGDYTGALTLASVTEDGQPHTSTVKLTLRMRVPRVLWAAPYVVYAGSEPEVIVRGTGLSGAAGQRLMFGQMAAAMPTLVSDAELRVTCPALAAGEVTVQIPNTLGLAPAGARLVVRAAGALPAAALGSLGRKWRVFFDDERQVLYGVDIDAKTLARVALRGNTWTTLPAFPVERLTDAAISTDGRSLVMATDGAGIFELDLTDANAAPRRVVAGDSFFSSLAFTNHGVAVLTTSAHGSGYTQVFTYDVLGKRAAPIAVAGNGFGLYAGRAYASGDGRLLLLSQNGLSPPPATVAFDASTDTTKETPIHRNVLRVTLNRDASRIIIDGTVYDRFFNPLGTLADDLHELRVLLSPDGKRAYASNYDSGTGTATDFFVYDLTTSPGAANVYPRLAPIALSPVLTESPDIFPPMMAIAGDGLTLFIWGGTGLQVVPLSP